MRKRGMKAPRKRRQVSERVFKFTERQRQQIAAGVRISDMVSRRMKGKKILSIRVMVTNEHGTYPANIAHDDTQFDRYFGPQNPLWEREKVDEFITGCVVRYC